MSQFLLLGMVEVPINKYLGTNNLELQRNIQSNLKM